MKWDVTPIEDGEFSVILPAEAVRHLVSVIPIKKDNICYMSVIEEHRKIIFNFIDFKYETQAVDGSFPDYKRVIPNGKIKMKKGMKADYLFSALKALNNSPVDISIDDRDTEDSVPHLLTSQEAKGVKCVVMPMRV
jgi:DNA polymerase III sliding clamp (beta) subunit (PCNA family)